MALSPDGRTIVYVGREGGSRVKLLRRELSTIEATPIAGSDGGSFPAISPDGRRVAFFGPGGMHVAPLAGGAPTTIADIQVVALGQAIWLDDNSFLVTESGGAISRLTMTGEMSRVASPDPSLSENYLGVYDLLPDGKRALVVAASGSGVNGTVLAIDVTSGERTVVMEELVNAVWYSDGYLVWATPSGQLLAAPFDPKRLTTSGQPTPLAERVRLAVGGPAQVGVSKNGSLVYVPEKPFNLMLLDEDGRREIIGEGRRFHNPRFSPDGRTLAMDFIQQGSRDVWTMDLRQRTLSRVTFEGDGHDAIWTPDGRYLYYITGIGIYRRRADGSGGADSVLVSGLLTGPLLFANRGRSLMTSPTGINGSFDIGMIDLGEERVQRPFLATPFGEESVALSPDERWLAYSSDETGRQELYVRPFPEGGAKTLVSLEGGNQPRWSPDGRVLYYWGSRHGVQYMIAAEVRADPVDGLVIEDREMLFEVSEFEPAAPHTNWDLSPDGRRFALVHQGTLSEMVFVQNWTEEVRASTGD